MAEYSIFPEDLLDTEPQTREDHRWWVAYTKVRQEKCLATELWRREIPFYLPLIRRNHVYRGRRLTSEVPLFGSYLFLCCTDAQRVRTLTTNRIAQLLEVPDGAQLQRELAGVRRLVESGVPLTVEGRLQPGDRIRVRHGSFAGLEGYVERRGRETRLVVAITFLQRGLSVEIDDYMVERIG
jgi:transcription antitermination factor NusG